VYEGAFFPESSPTFVLVFLMTADLTLVRWNLSVVLICISFMATLAEQFFMLIIGHLYFS
jgi:hypothetical protein